MIKKYRVGVRPMPDQSNSHFRQVRDKPRTKVFRTAVKAYDYYCEVMQRAQSEQFEAFFQEVLT